ncbi:O-antigen ligase family protein [Duganella sp. sic0402]|uniref:O-antigen ligase family protein n=1 Tax=Duganella sp. sic0402 TaxID=2854786 RepID=UPI001C472A5B|nr:O-antigen ligase family protein [Duganella sp. sic0402]MBV7535969.1 O-antigen ligase family protein [Duganella sp. sic0402]
MSAMLRQYSAASLSALAGIFTRANLKRLVLLWLPVLLLSSFIGLCCVMLPWMLNAALIGAVVYAVVMLASPWLGLFMYVVVILFAPDVKLADVATAASLLAFCIHLLRLKKINYALPREVRWPLWGFAALVLLSFVTAIAYFHTQIPYIYRDGRNFIYWLWLPLLAVYCGSTPDGVRKLNRVMLAVAILVSVMALFAAVTGIQLAATGRVGSLETAGAAQGAFTRVQMPGFPFVTWALVWLVVMMLYRRVNMAVGILLGGLLAAALVVNFGRALWVWTLIGMLIPVFFIGQSRTAKLLVTLVTVGALGIAALAIAKPSTLDAIMVRMMSVKDEGGKNTSYGWREWENQDAVAALKRSPVIGVGMGGEYRNWIPILRVFAEHTRYIHESYLYIALKLGVFGLLLMLMVFWRAWRHGRRSMALAEQEDRLPLLASLCVFPAWLGLCLTQPELMLHSSVFFMTCILTVLLSSYRGRLLATAAQAKHKSSWGALA